MISVLIIDDEQKARNILRHYLTENVAHPMDIREAESADAALAILEDYAPDIVFLDIEMPHMNGFDMLEQFDKIFFDVVFCTAYDQFAIRAFRYSALNYLLKPVDPDDLKETIRRLEEKKSTPSREQIELLLQNMQQAVKPTLQRIALTANDGMIFVSTEDILYCQAESNYTSVVLKGGKKILVSKVLKDIDETLAGKDFFRVHNSFLINLNHINRFVRGEGGYVVMDDGATIGISRSRRQDFMEQFSKF